MEMVLKSDILVLKNDYVAETTVDCVSGYYKDCFVVLLLAMTAGFGAGVFFTVVLNS